MIRKGQHPRFLAGVVNGRCGRLAPPVMPQLVRSREILDSIKGVISGSYRFAANTHFVISDKVVRTHALDL